jgi:hypothetical protein
MDFWMFVFKVIIKMSNFQGGVPYVKWVTNFGFGQNQYIFSILYSITRKSLKIYGNVTNVSMFIVKLAYLSIFDTSRVNKNSMHTYLDITSVYFYQ